MTNDSEQNGDGAAKLLEVRDLQTLLVPVGKIRPNAWNPNVMSDMIVQAERESIRRFGFIDPITVMAEWEEGSEFDYVIIDGEHRWRIAQEPDPPHREGYTELPVVVLDITVDDAKRLTIVLNETRGDADVVKLGILLTELQQAAENPDDFRAALPYSAADLDHFLSLGAVDWDQFEATAGDPAAPKAQHELVLSFETEKAMTQFKERVEIIRRERELGDVTLTAVVDDTVLRDALALNQA